MVGICLAYRGLIYRERATPMIYVNISNSHTLINRQNQTKDPLTSRPINDPQTMKFVETLAELGS